MEILWVKSESRGMVSWPSPPSVRGVLTHARWVKCESTEHATTSAFIALNSFALSLKARISVGQTKVLQRSKEKLHKSRLHTDLKKHLQIQRVEEEHQVLSLVIRQLDFLKCSINDRCTLPFRCWPGNWKRPTTITKKEINIIRAITAYSLPESIEDCDRCSSPSPSDTRRLRRIPDKLPHSKLVHKKRWRRQRWSTICSYTSLHFGKYDKKNRNQSYTTSKNQTTSQVSALYEIRTRLFWKFERPHTTWSVSRPGCGHQTNISGRWDGQGRQLDEHLAANWRRRWSPPLPSRAPESAMVGRKNHPDWPVIGAACRSPPTVLVYDAGSVNKKCGGQPKPTRADRSLEPPASQDTPYFSDMGETWTVKIRHFKHNDH